MRSSWSRTPFTQTRRGRSTFCTICTNDDTVSLVLTETEQRVIEGVEPGGVSGAYPSLYNSPVQTVVGGRADALARATATLKEGGVRRLDAFMGFTGFPGSLWWV